ncbi:CAP domain-containing protein [Stappia sp. F7233]|uniref:CAP domain-containing protein n=1 Tax=Stappia albiluteola TaxID=2758565 RepID=A0A839ABU3_9HYPH|nr:CAP domain-containing protein [Stappia albiluteola]MBA5776422.1 CAP domain-containing protein [Stappia albiluteola]
MAKYPGSRRAFLIAASSLPLALAGCAGFGSGNSAAEISDVPVDRADALAKVNAYRAAKGLHPLAADARLDAASRDMAHLIAENDSLSTRQHSASGLARRLDGSGYRNYAGAENLGAGYKDFDAAFAGWKGSKDHDKNLLNPYVTRVGIARTRRADGKWRNFWVMILSRPEEDGRPTL